MGTLSRAEALRGVLNDTNRHRELLRNANALLGEQADELKRFDDHIVEQEKLICALTHAVVLLKGCHSTDDPPTRKVSGDLRVNALKKANVALDLYNQVSKKTPKLNKDLVSEEVVKNQVVLPGDENKTTVQSPFNKLYGLRNKHNKALVNRTYLDARIARKPPSGLCSFYACDYDMTNIGDAVPAIFLTRTQASVYHGQVPFFDGENLEVFEISL